MAILFALTSTATIGYVLFALIGFIGLSVLGYAVFLEPYILVYTKWKLPFPIQGLKIAIVGDFHAGPFKGRRFIERVVKKTNKAKPDLIFLVGDFLFDGKAKPAPLEALKGLQSTYGVFAVLGNHENGHVLRHWRTFREEVHHTPLVKTLRAANIVTLHNETAVITINGQQLALVGIDDLWSGLDDLPRALESLPPNIPSVLLCHNPDVILDPDCKRFDLVVSGHTHAGQVRLPFIGSVGPIPQQLSRKYDQGLFQVSEKTRLMITRGVGESALQLRLFAPPEVMIVDTI